MEVRDAYGVVGHILNTRNDGTFVFRVYKKREEGETGELSYVDYDLRVDDLRVQIMNPLARLVKDDEGKNYMLDHSRSHDRHDSKDGND
jgi:hypothetical protein